MSTEAPEQKVRVVGRYALHRQIAAGGMATVHLGRLLGEVGFSRTVAIKRLHSRLAGDRQFVNMLIDEARLAARIRHPNVVPVLDVVAQGEEVFLVMEYIHGQSLSQIMRTRAGAPLPARIVTSVVSGALHGLHAAHEACTEHGEPLNIVHRDVSPQNMLVGADGLARMVDFGIAKAAKRLHETQAGELKGKFSYMAPEQLRKTGIDRRTDVYAAGVVLHEALTGRKLFVSDPPEAIRRILAGEIPRPSSIVDDVPAEVEAVALRALHVEPSERFQTAREMAMALERALPSAPASEVAEWVESVAGPALALRAAELAEVERACALSADVDRREAPADLGKTRLYSSPRAEPAAAAPAPATASAESPPSAVVPAAPSNDVAARAPMPSAPMVYVDLPSNTQVSVTGPTAPAARSHGWFIPALLIAGALGLAVIAIIGVIAFRKIALSETDSAAPGVAAAPARVTATAPAATEPEPAPTPVVSAEPARSAETPASASVVASSTTSPPVASPRATAAKPASPSKPTSTPKKPSAPDPFDDLSRK